MAGLAILPIKTNDTSLSATWHKLQATQRATAQDPTIVRRHVASIKKKVPEVQYIKQMNPYKQTLIAPFTKQFMPGFGANCKKHQHQNLKLFLSLSKSGTAVRKVGSVSKADQLKMVIYTHKQISFSASPTALIFKRCAPFNKICHKSQAL